MITILKHGTNTYFQRCWKCGCEFIYEKNDTIEWLGNSNNIKITCPDCGEALKCTFEKWEETK